MPYQSRAERERAQWRTLPEALAHICAADRCDQDDARKQLCEALTDGALRPLRWEDARPASMIGGTTVPLDIPPGRNPHWETVQIDWQAGTVRDDWGEAGPRHRVLLIHRLKLREHWPEMRPGVPAAEPAATAVATEPKESVEVTRARGKPGPKPKLRDSLGAKMFDDLSSGQRTPEELKGDKLSALAAQYGGSPNTANAARQDALLRFSELQNSRSNEL